ncbi:MAG: DNA-binding protein [Clostridia bacterium]|nr:DNA-binding protein [Clostridia bacterium]
MEYRTFGSHVIIRLDRGEEVLTALTEICRQEQISLATIEGLGAIDHAIVCVYDVPTKTFYRQTFDEPMEISHLGGTVTQKDGDVYLHVHATLCDRNLLAHGGHVNELRVSATCEIVLHCIAGTVDREYNEAIGLNLFRFS